MRKFLVVMVLLFIFLAACSNTEEGQEQASSVNDGAMMDLREETNNQDTLPNFLDDHHENMQIVYKAVAEHRELLEHMPCYCGCGESVGHEHNYHCFIHDNTSDGTVVWDDHATRCQVCLDIAVESIIEFEDGKSINDIRDEMDKQYKNEGYPEPTETPRHSA